MTDVLETIKNLIRSGASSDEIVETLRSMGIEEDEARKLILLAEKDMLRVLRNEIREIAADAFEEKAMSMRKELSAEVAKMVEMQMKSAHRQIFSMIHAEMNKYISTLSSLEEKVNLLEKKVYDIEEQVYALRKQRGKIRKKLSVGTVLIFLGVGVLMYAIVTGATGASAYPFFAAALALIFGGILFG